MVNVKVLFSKEDGEMIEDLKKVFGEELSFTEEYDFIGDTIFVYVIPAVALAVQVLDFILTHVVNKQKETKENNASISKDVREKRKVEIDGERISLVGYSAEEIEQIAKSLGLEKWSYVEQLYLQYWNVGRNG